MKRLLAVVLFGALTADLPADDLLSLLADEGAVSRSASGRRKPTVLMPAGVGRIVSEPAAKSDDAKPPSDPPEKTTDRVVEKPIDRVVVVERTNLVEKVVDRVVEKPVVVEKQVVVEKPVEVEKVVVVERTNLVEKVVDRVVEKPVVVEKQVVVEKPVEVERVVVVERTNVVEKIVRDTARETQLLERERQLLDRQKELQSEQARLTADCQKLSEERKALAEQVNLVSNKNESLVGANMALGDQLAKERDRRQRLERVIPKENRQFSDQTLTVDARSAFYDRKEGYVAFEGNVHVADKEYVLWASRAFVFTDQTNSVKYLVALGNVAVTNGTKRAYGTKASYYRKTGMVVLHGDANTPAVVRDESRVDDQEVIGEKIKFWTNSEQVEVLKARISAPLQGTGDIKNTLIGR